MKKELSKADSKTYLAIVKSGNMDAMFDFAYVCGRVDATRDSLEMVTGVNESEELLESDK